MFTNESTPERGESKQYLVQCDGCSFERPAAGRDAATTIGTSHRQETRHDVVVVEVPPSMHSR